MAQKPDKGPAGMTDIKQTRYTGMVMIRLAKTVKLEDGLASEGGGFLSLGSKASLEGTACVL